MTAFKQIPAGTEVRCISSNADVTCGKVYVLASDYTNVYLRTPNSLVTVQSDEGYFVQVYSKRFELIEEDVKPVPKDTPRTGLGTQVDGSHYTDLVIQPVEYVTKNKLSFLRGNVIKYISRDKHGIIDIDKAIHCLELIKELEYDGDGNLTTT